MYELAQYADRLKKTAAQFRRAEPEAHRWPADLLDFIPALSPHLSSPTWLGPVVDPIEAFAAGNPVNSVVSTPPQHGKTELLKHALIWCALRLPGDYVFLTYAQEKANLESHATQVLAERAGLATSGTLRYWRTNNGSSFLFTSIGGVLTGYPANRLFIIDDPHEGYEDSHSPTQRAKVDARLRTEAFTRQHPGTCFLLVQTRWHQDDQAGKFIKLGWPYINLPAINDGTDPRREVGEPLWPEERGLAWLEKRRAELTAHYWAALFQGQPRPLGAEVFGPPHHYTSLPTEGYRVGYGVDLAYTAKTHADYSVCVRAWAVGDKLYIVDVQRKQVDAPSFLLTLKAMHSAQPGRMRWHASGTEKGAAQFIKQRLPALHVVPAKGDKFVRSQDVAAAWNAGRVLVPEGAPWLAAFLEEVQSFTGVGDVHDDQVDALASAHSLLIRRSADAGRSIFDQWRGQNRWRM